MTPWSPRRGRRTAFTLVELMVAMGLFMGLLLLISTIFNLSKQIVGLGMAISDVETVGRALETRMRDDLRNVARDGFLVVSTQDIAYAGEPVPADGLTLLVNGDFDTRRIDTANRPTIASSGTARVTYAHVASPEFLAGEDPLTWSLGRQALVLSPVYDPAKPAEYLGNTSTASPIAGVWDPAVADGENDLAFGGLLMIRGDVAASASPADRAAEMAVRVRNRRIPVRSDPVPDQLMQIHALLAPHCPSFRVQFAGDFDGDGEVDRGGPGDEILWYGIDEAGALVAPPSGVATSTVGGRRHFVFGLDASGGGPPDPWPRMLRVTVRLLDQIGTYRRYHDRAPDQYPDGKTFRFVLPLPDA